MITRAHILQLFALLEAGGCRPQPTLGSDDFLDVAVATWSALLADLEPEELMAAAVAFLRTPDSNWWPTPGRLLSLTPGRAADEIDDAPEAWALVMRALHDQGRDRPPPKDWAPFGNPARDEALRWALKSIGYWRDLCLQDIGVLETSIRAAFRDAYRAARQRQRLARQETGTQRLIENLLEHGLPSLLCGGTIDKLPGGDT
ncbi:MAG: hypothetical protein ABIO70_10065 [Pseudomonadota bacterium]